MGKRHHDKLNVAYMQLADITKNHLNGVIGRYCKNILEDYIKTIVYEQSPERDSYKRTMQLLNSVEFKVDTIRGENAFQRDFLLTIYIRDDKIHDGVMWYDVDGDEVSAKKGDRVNIATVARILDENLNKGRKDDTAFMDKAIKEMEEKKFYIDSLMRCFESHGFKVNR